MINNFRWNISKWRKINFILYFVLCSSQLIIYLLKIGKLILRKLLDTFFLLKVSCEYIN